jgi:hypothetical protein
MYIENREMYVTIFLIISLLFLFIGIRIFIKWKILNKRKTAFGIIFTIIGLLSVWITYTVSGINETKKTTQDIQVVSKLEDINFKRDITSLKNLKEYFEFLYGEYYVVYQENSSASDTVNELMVTLQDTSFIIKLNKNEEIARKEFDKMYSNLQKKYIQKDENSGSKRYCITYKYKTLYRNFPWNSKVIYRYKNLTFEIIDSSSPDKIANQDTIKILDALIQEANNNLKPTH